MVTSDANGNLASDQGATVARISENQQRIERAVRGIGANTNAIGLLNTEFESLSLRTADLTSRLAVSENQIASNASDIEENRSGIAIANALAGSSWLSSGKSTALTGNWGNFKGQNAFAISAAQRLDDKWSLNAAFGVDPEQGDAGARAGVRVEW